MAPDNREEPQATESQTGNTSDDVPPLDDAGLAVLQAIFTKLLKWDQEAQAANSDTERTDPR